MEAESTITRSGIATMDEIREQGLTYRLDALYLGTAHYKAAEQSERQHRWIGGPAAILGAAVGTSIFATIQENPSLRWRVIAGLATLAVAILAALQTFYRFDKRAQEHRSAGGAYASLRRSLDLFLLDAEEGSSRESLIQRLDEFRKRFDEIAASTPLIPPSAYERARKQMKIEEASDATSTGRTMRATPGPFGGGP